MTTPGDSPIDVTRARRLVAAERARIESSLADLDGAVRDEGDLQSQQAGDTSESGTEMAAEGVAMALGDGLRGRLLEAYRAAKRLDTGIRELLKSPLALHWHRFGGDDLAVFRRQFVRH